MSEETVRTPAGTRSGARGRRRQRDAASVASPQILPPAATPVAAATVVALPSELHIAEVAAFRAALDNVLRQSQAVRLDAAALTVIDTAGLQLLLAFRRAAAARGLACTFGARSEALREAARLAGLAPDLGLDA